MAGLQHGAQPAGNTAAEPRHAVAHQSAQPSQTDRPCTATRPRTIISAPSGASRRWWRAAASSSFSARSARPSRIFLRAWAILSSLRRWRASALIGSTLSSLTREIGGFAEGAALGRRFQRFGQDGGIRRGTASPASRPSSRLLGRPPSRRRAISFSTPAGSSGYGLDALFQQIGDRIVSDARPDVEHLQRGVGHMAIDHRSGQGRVGIGRVRPVPGRMPQWSSKLSQCIACSAASARMRWRSGMTAGRTGARTW